MKAYVLILFLAAYQSFAHRTTLSDIRRLWRRIAGPFESECIRNTSVQLSTVDEFHEYGALPDDPDLKCYFRCAGSKLQILNSAGGINVEKMAQIVDYVDPALAQKCSKIVKHPDPCQKAYLLVRCLHDNLSLRYLL
ncbi:hypothetical protein ILUMI_05060 [Ignelater luminosus]|uniref:Uncharacterized protein n=1 Tax=Ignelater luminosus TaxID=2038154 RepID=A0A8K0GJ04_IGNLU|nr:hypothetical protein ILUMI_05060 [Ignelater luminosus]